MATGETVKVRDISKTFTLHLSGPAILNALEKISFSAQAGKCLALTGPSGSGKSSLLRCIYGNYLISGGEIYLRDGKKIIPISQSSPRDILDLRKRVLSYVSQFLRVIPRVSALEVVAEPLTFRGFAPDEAQNLASDLLSRLHVPKRLQMLPPATFSGGERQRVNIARGLIWSAPILLLDEPTASLDSANKKVVIELIHEAKARGTTVIGVFHDQEALSAVADDIYQMRPKKEYGLKRASNSPKILKAP
ncbi:MAG: phosphonate C-P lyase system protein PhnL [Deltaproteobacteria bacterium]|nr:phosphonate C-P lyase system protein PhnL [Deltaproteobacteria bacterium]